jgi:hypothetical protein
MLDKKPYLNQELGHFLRDNNLENYIIKPITQNDKRKTLGDYMKENGVDDIGIFSIQDEDERAVVNEVRICSKCKRSDVEFYEPSATIYCKGCRKDCMKVYNKKTLKEVKDTLENLQRRLRNYQ